MNIPSSLVGTALVVGTVAFWVGRKSVLKKQLSQADIEKWKLQRAPWTQNQWDEFQETMMIAAALILYGGFEIMCFLNNEYANATHTNQTRMALVTIVTNLFTFKFTKSLPSRNGA